MGCLRSCLHVDIHWRQPLGSREPSCSGCGRRWRAEGRSALELRWPTCAKMSCENSVLLQGCAWRPLTANCGWKCQNLEKRCWPIYLLMLRRQEFVWWQVVWSTCATGMNLLICLTTCSEFAKTCCQTQLCLSYCKDNGWHQDKYRLDRGCHLDFAWNFDLNVQRQLFLLNQWFVKQKQNCAFWSWKEM